MTAVKKTAFLLLVVALVAAGCKGRAGTQDTAKTETMAPAVPASTVPETTDPMTQTVDIEDSRSIAEGGADETTVASGTATAAKKKTGGAATSRRTPPSQSRPPGRTQ